MLLPRPYPSPLRCFLGGDVRMASPRARAEAAVGSCVSQTMGPLGLWLCIVAEQGAAALSPGPRIPLATAPETLAGLDPASGWRSPLATPSVLSICQGSLRKGEGQKF